MVDKVALGQVFLPVIRCSVNIIQPVLHTYSSSSTCCNYQNAEGVEHGNLPKSSAFFGVGDQRENKEEAKERFTIKQSAYSVMTTLNVVLMTE
jgi:hypothetical protein